MEGTHAAGSPAISVVVPVYNEEGSVENLHAELVEVLDTLTKKEQKKEQDHVRGFEIIYVNDGSSDNSLKVLLTLSHVVVLDLARRYGQSTALDAGFKLAKGELLISIDGDGQNDPHDIPLLLKELAEKNLDVVAGWRAHRSDRQGIKLMTRIGRGMRSLFINDSIHDSGCMLRVYRREAVHSIDLQGEMHRYLLAMLRWKGFRIGEVKVNDRPRMAGTSKYGYSKAIRGFIDLIYVWFLYKYSDRPFHFFGYLGLTSFALSFVSLCFTIYDRIASGTHINHNGWFFLTFFFLLMAIMLFSFGIVIDLLLRIYYNSSPQETRYSIRKVFTK
jgi:glycosyltransferase involved in cell wall biosynthesis